MNYKGCWLQQSPEDGTYTIYGFDHVVDDGFESLQSAKDYLDEYL